MGRFSSGHVESRKVQRILKKFYGRDSVSVGYDAQTQALWDEGDNIYRFYWTNKESESEMFSVSGFHHGEFRIRNVSNGKMIDISVGKSIYDISKSKMAKIIVDNYEELH